MEDRIQGDLALAVIADELSVSFGERKALKRLSVNLPVGALTVAVGRSGSGKTTFLRSLNRLNEFFPNCVTTGSLRVRLREKWIDLYLDSFSVQELRRRVGMVFQTPHLIPTSIEENIALPLKLVRRLSKGEVKDRVEWALREVHLWDEVKDRLKASSHTLSGGQQQRLCLARTLALEPQVLLLDEPTASLDFVSAAKIEELLLGLRGRYTIIAVSHSLGQARRIADRILVFREGCIVREINRQQRDDPELFWSLVEEVF